MARRLAKTAARGLGGPHQNERQAALRGMRDGELCFRCQLRGVEHPMYRVLIARRPDGRLVAAMLELDHWPGRAVGGPQISRLSYRHCNRQAGALLGNALRRMAKTPPRLAGQGYTRW